MTSLALSRRNGTKLPETPKLFKPTNAGEAGLGQRWTSTATETLRRQQREERQGRTGERR